MFDARRRLNQTDLVFKLAQEIIRNAQNNVEQLKLENYQLARNFADGMFGFASSTGTVEANGHFSRETALTYVPYGTVNDKEGAA